MAKKKTGRDQYESYEGFLRAAIRAYWEAGAKSKVNFLALLLASRAAWQVAWEGVSGSGTKILTGAAGAAAIALILRAVVGGPIGILLTGASIASLVAIYVKNHRRIWAKVERYGQILDDYRDRYDQQRSDFVEGGLSESRFELVVDGLMSRLLVELDEFEPEDPDDADDEESDDEDRPESFAAHAERKREAARAETTADEDADDDET